MTMVTPRTTASRSSRSEASKLGELKCSVRESDSTPKVTTFLFGEVRQAPVRDHDTLGPPVEPEV